MAFEAVGETGDLDWVALPGGELEAPPRQALCAACREALRAAARRGLPGRDVRRAGTLCFACHRAEARRQQTLKAAGELFTGSADRLQAGLPFEPVDRARLARLKLERGSARAASIAGHGRFADRRRHAQLEARRALSALALGLHARTALPLPESWLPFVVGGKRTP